MSWARVVAGCRWDAVALLDALPCLRAYLVQIDRSHWTLHVECDRDEHDLLDELLPRIESWLHERSLPCTVIEIAGTAHIFRADEDPETASRLADALPGAASGHEPPLLEHELAQLLADTARPDGERSPVSAALARAARQP